MNFEPVNYAFLLQDFVFAMAAGFAAAFIKEVLSCFLSGGRTAVFIRDIISCFIFSVLVFSFVISFANYPDIRIYHVAGALLGFLSFNISFGKMFHNLFKRAFLKIKSHILCPVEKIKHTICAGAALSAQKKNKKAGKEKSKALKNKEQVVYNL